MKTLTKTLLLTGILGLASLIPSCQTTSATGNSAVTCSKCKTVWVSSPTAIGPSRKPYIVYRDKKIMTCPDCESAAATFFKTGSLKHHCAHCGDTLAHCETH